MLIPVHERFLTSYPWGWRAGEVMTMQSDNKGDSLTDNLWAEMSLMMVLVVIVLAVAWRYVW
jgi:hypothetical protein